MIGSVREKGSIIEQGVVVRLLQILRAPELDILLKTEVATVLNSLAKGLPEHATALVQAGLLPVLWERESLCCCRVYILLGLYESHVQCVCHVWIVYICCVCVCVY